MELLVLVLIMGLIGVSRSVLIHQEATDVTVFLDIL